MARRARSTAKPNTVDPKIVNSILDRWDDIQDQRASLLGAFRAECKEFKDSEKGLLEEAKARGVDPKLLKKDIKRRKLLRQVREIEDGVSKDFIAEWEAIVEATAARLAGKTDAAAEKDDLKRRNADAVSEFERLN